MASALTFLAAVLAAAAPATPAPAPAPSLQPGVYGQIDPATHRTLQPGNRLVIVRGNRGQLGFSLNAVGSDGGQGYVVGRLPTANAPQTWSQSLDGARCRLTFALERGALAVAQDRPYGDCGFGTGVVATGAYARVADDEAVDGPVRR